MIALFDAAMMIVMFGVPVAAIVNIAYALFCDSRDARRARADAALKALAKGGA